MPPKPGVLPRRHAPAGSLPPQTHTPSHPWHQGNRAGGKRKQDRGHCHNIGDCGSSNQHVERGFREAFSHPGLAGGNEEKGARGDTRFHPRQAGDATTRVAPQSQARVRNRALHKRSHAHIRYARWGGRAEKLDRRYPSSRVGFRSNRSRADTRHVERGLLPPAACIHARSRLSSPWSPTSSPLMMSKPS